MNPKSVTSQPHDVAKHCTPWSHVGFIFPVSRHLAALMLAVFPACIWAPARIQQWVITQSPGNQKTGKKALTHEPTSSPADLLCQGKEQSIAPAVEPRVNHRHPREATAGPGVRLV